MAQVIRKISSDESARLKQVTVKYSTKDDEDRKNNYLKRTDGIIKLTEEMLTRTPKLDASSPVDTKTLFGLHEVFLALEGAKKSDDELTRRSAGFEYRDLWTHYSSEDAAKPEASLWIEICREQLLATAHTDVDGKYSIEVPGGHYYVYAAFESSNSEVEWFVPVTVGDVKDVSVDLHNENAARIRNKMD